ncbi:hypothetical protein V3C99_004948 [Haemonchus contortus]
MNEGVASKQKVNPALSRQLIAIRGRVARSYRWTICSDNFEKEANALHNLSPPTEENSTLPPIAAECLRRYLEKVSFEFKSPNGMLARWCCRIRSVLTEVNAVGLVHVVRL